MQVKHQAHIRFTEPGISQTIFAFCTTGIRQKRKITWEFLTLVKLAADILDNQEVPGHFGILLHSSAAKCGNNVGNSSAWICKLAPVLLGSEKRLYLFSDQRPNNCTMTQIYLKIYSCFQMTPYICCRGIYFQLNFTSRTVRVM